MLYAADAAANNSAGNITSMLLPMALMVGVFVVLIILPQRKQKKEHQNMVASLKKGDRVLTSGGMYGIVDSFKDNETVVIKIANNTKVEFTKAAIQVKLP